MQCKSSLSRLACVLTLATASSALAAPLMEQRPLPIALEDFQQLQSELDYSAEEARQFLNLLTTVEVFADHRNPKSVDQLYDKSVTKKYYAAPLLQVSQTDAIVGTDEISTYLFTAVDELDRLVRTLNFRVYDFARILARIRDQTAQQEAQRAARDAATDAAMRETFQKSLDKIEQDLRELRAELARMREEASNGVDALGPELRREIVQTIVFELSRLGIAPTEEDEADLWSDNPDRVVTALARLRVRMSSGQFGIRQVTLVAGLDEEQQRVFSSYRLIRPDIEVVSLPLQSIDALPTVQTYFQGERHETDAHYAVRAVNGGGEGGSCGGRRTCNVVVEYTLFGARQQAGSRSSRVLLPVGFQGIVDVAQPEFDGEIRCSFEVGWFARGRRDVRDGLIIYDGDVTGGIDYGSFGRDNDSPCTFSFRRGSKDSAYYHLLDVFFNKMLNFFYERVQKSAKDKDDYERYIRQEIEEQQNRAQNRETGSWEENVFTFVAVSNPLVAAATWLFGESREFYWHTRTENMTMSDSIDFGVRINVGPDTTALKPFKFDATPHVCFSKTNRQDIVPCSTLAGLTTQTEAGGNTCPLGTPMQLCQRMAEQQNQATPDDEPTPGPDDPFDPL